MGRFDSSLVGTRRDRAARAMRRGGVRYALVCAGILTCMGCDGGTAALRIGKGPRGATLEVGRGGQELGEMLRTTPPVDDPRGARLVALPTADQISDGPARRFRTVALKPGQTLSQLCAEQLGSADRWREVARLNGWDDEQVRRLRSGELVRLPPA